MNIFVFDRDALEAAWMMDDLRLGKMLIESGQLLATGLRERGATMRCSSVQNRDVQGDALEVHPPQPPMRRVARATYGGFRWLSRHAIGLAECFSYRRGRAPASRYP